MILHPACPHQHPPCGKSSAVLSPSYCADASLQTIIEVNSVIRQGLERGLPIMTLMENWDFLVGGWGVGWWWGDGPGEMDLAAGSANLTTLGKPNYALDGDPSDWADCGGG
jgi:hypothetical protein